MTNTMNRKVNIAVIGTGYEGLETATVFADLGNDVIAVDVNEEKVRGLKAGRMPFYEPGMEEMVARNHADGRLDFLMIGMPSPTADRLEHLNLWRPDSSEDRTMRSKMTYGNRLYLARTAAHELVHFGDAGG